MRALSAGAAARTEGALSDFDVDYALRVAIDRPLARVPIMSPQCFELPPQPAVVPKDRWFAAPAQPAR